MYSPAEKLPIVVVPEMPEDAEARRRAAAFIGAVAIEASTAANIKDVLATDPIESLQQAIKLAAEGNEQARKLIEINARTDVIERTMKSGHVLSVDLMVDESGKILQHNQTMESVHANSLRFAANNHQMRERTEAETRNAFRIEQLLRQGKLDDHSFVVISRAADNMPITDMKQVGFFTETMSCAIQVTTVKGGRLTTESAFVAGIRRLGEARHDAETTRGVAATFGVSLESMSATEVIDTPLLIHNSLLRGGAMDLVKAWDNSAGGTFFGEAKPQQDYDAYRQVCKEREARFAPKVERIADQLISEARTINSPLMATQRLHKISEEHMIEQAIGDDDIDPRVFGPAAIDIERAREAYINNRPQQLLEAMRSAKEKAQSSSCPSGAFKSEMDEENTDGQKSTSKNDECEFVSKECPLCHKKNVKTKVTKKRIIGACGCSVDK